MPAPIMKVSKDLLVALGAEPVTAADCEPNKTFFVVPPSHLCLMDYDMRLWRWKKVPGCERSQ